MEGNFKDFIEKVKSVADIVEVIGSYVPLKKRGNKYWGCCPFHGEKTPSFAVDESKQLFYCFGCHVGGDIFKFLQQKEGISFVDAIKRLAERYNILIPEKQKSAAELVKEREFNRLSEVNAWAAKYFAACLHHERVGAKAREYLAQRGITEEIICNFQIGFARNTYNDLLAALGTKGISVEEMVKVGLVLSGRYSNFYDKFRNRVMIPIKDPRGRIVGFGGRVLGEGEPKYLNTGETNLFNKRFLLFGFDLALKSMREKKQAVVVEGYMDAISLHSAGFANVVASMGTAFSEQQAAILRRNVGEIVFCYDSDVPGRNASVRACTIVRHLGLSVRVALVPGAKDPDEYVRIQGKEAFQIVLDKAVGGLEFQIQETLKKFNLSTVGGKVQAVRNIVPFFQDCQNVLEVREAIRHLSQILTIEEVLIVDEYQRFKNSRQSIQNQQEFSAEIITQNNLPDNRTELTLLALLWKYPVFLNDKRLFEIRWSKHYYEDIFKKMQLLQNNGYSLSGLGDDSSMEVNSILALMQLMKFPDGQENKIFQDCLKNLYLQQLRENYDIHASLASKYEEAGDSRMLEELKICEEIRNVIKKIC